MPPEGYAERNNKETAPKTLLRYCSIDRNNIKKGFIPIVLALHNGIVIMSWQIDEVTPETFQAEIFSVLEPGANLPKKPMKITCELWPEDFTEEFIYTGKHLACTQKDGRFYEWAIFIPSKNIQIQRGLRHKITVQWDSDKNEVDNFVKSVETLVIKENEYDFGVRGAMAEMSDEGIAPEHVTYENIVKLVDEIRVSEKD